ncbi:MAG TPA: ribosome biogenesis GTPase Der [Verrucomicrobiae bacterium]|nr:ribosome biogenesis GTPase Der [Verrucomicrobiae bacterium]
MSGLIAIVGRPNVGKSALFNRIIKKRIAIVHDQPGVTRDRVTAETEWHGRTFTLVDTGGIGLLRREKSDDVIVKAALEQVELAIESASAIIFVVNVQEGIVPLDREVAERLRKCGKTILVAANKVDTERMEKDADEFVALGFDKIFPVSAIHGEGIVKLMDAAFALLPPPDAEEQGAMDAEAAEPVEGEEEAEDKPRIKGPLKLAIVGRPNVGKSSIINALTQSTRVIVTPIAGTTRDSVDVPFEVETEGVRQKYILIDTAGMRKTRRVDDTIEFFSVQRSTESIIRSDITILVIDAEAGVTEQDKKIADTIVENRRACIIVINKWDLFEKDVKSIRQEEIDKRNAKKRTEGQAKNLTTLVEFGAWVQKKLFFLDYAPVIFTSAKSGFHLERLLETIRYVAAQLQQKVPTSILNRALRDAVDKRQPVTSTGMRLKFYYATQVRQAPPTFLLFVNRDEMFSDPYKKYLAGEMRTAFGYEGCPVVLVPKPRPKTVESKQRFRQKPGGKPTSPGNRQDAYRQKRHERYGRVHGGASGRRKNSA